MDVKNLIINALLAGFWAGLAAFSDGGALSKGALIAAGAIAARAVVGYLSDKLGHPVVVDKPSA